MNALQKFSDLRYIPEVQFIGFSEKEQKAFFMFSSIQARINFVSFVRQLNEEMNPFTPKVYAETEKTCGIEALALPIIFLILGLHYKGEAQKQLANFSWQPQFPVQAEQLYDP